MSAATNQSENRNFEKERYTNVKILRGPKIGKVLSTKRDAGIILLPSHELEQGSLLRRLQSTSRSQWREQIAYGVQKMDYNLSPLCSALL